MRWLAVLGDWMSNEVQPKGYDAYDTDPGVTDMSPLRLLVIRMIQGRQGVLVDSQQHASSQLIYPQRGSQRLGGKRQRRDCGRSIGRVFSGGRTVARSLPDS